MYFWLGLLIALFVLLAFIVLGVIVVYNSIANCYKIF